MDWHGYAQDQVATWADQVIEAAFEHGFRYVEFVHGAAEIRARGTLGYQGAPPEGRGQIKQLLRKRLFGRQWQQWVKERREGGHRLSETAMVIALRENPEPNPSAPWPLIPPPEH
jgi:hypothetical protein